MDFENEWFKGWALRFVQRRCPELSESELEEAAQNLLTYMEVVWDIHQRISEERREISERLSALHQYDENEPADGNLS